jgi:hypothetical protein
MALSNYLEIKFMLKNILIFIATLYCYLPCKSQNVVELYYNTINKADSLNYISNEKEKALILYLKAIDLCKNNNLFISSNDDILKIQTILALKDDNVAINDLFIYMIKRGINIDEYNNLKNNEFALKPFFKTKYASFIDNKFDSLYKLHIQTRNLSLDFRMVSLLTQDQYSRRVLNINGVSRFIASDTIAKLKNFIFNTSDCEIRNSIVLLIKDSSFLKINCNTNYSLGLLRILLLHNFFNRELNQTDSSCSYLKFYNFIEPQIRKLVNIGKFKNLSYAFLIDRANCWGNSDSAKQIYGTHLDNDKKTLLYPIFDIENVDKRRAEIFLPSLYQASIIEGFKLPKEYIYRK